MPSVSATSSARSVSSSPASASPAASGGALEALPEGGEVFRLVGAGARRELGEQRLEAGSELKRRFPRTALIEVGARSQEQRFAGVDRLATGEHGRDALLWPQGLRTVPAAPGQGNLHGLLPAPFG